MRRRVDSSHLITASSSASKLHHIAARSEVTWKATACCMLASLRGISCIFVMQEIPSSCYFVLSSKTQANGTARLASWLSPTVGCCSMLAACHIVPNRLASRLLLYLLSRHMQMLASEANSGIASRVPADAEPCSSVQQAKSWQLLAWSTALF